MRRRIEDAIESLIFFLDDGDPHDEREPENEI
jgi:hypothetical protein